MEEWLGISLREINLFSRLSAVSVSAVVQFSNVEKRRATAPLNTSHRHVTN